MGQVLHGSAATIGQAKRRHLSSDTASSESLIALSKQYGINPKTGHL